jgi:hypothetical protein
MIIALLVVVILMGTTLLVMVLDDLNMFERPYPSESTPLSLVDGKVVWTGQLDYWMSENETFDYRNLRLAWGIAHSGGYTTNELANYTQLSTGTEATASRLFFDFSIHVTDLLGNGLFQRGDYVTFDFAPEGIPEDAVHSVALADVVSEWNQEFSFAIHNGGFYSWRSDTLPADYPWWVHFYA